MLKRINWELIAIFALTIAINIPAYSQRFVPCEDTLFGFQQFFIQYSELTFHHTWAHWYPYIFYGQPSYMYWLQGPIGYVACVVGAGLKIANVADVFKSVIVLDEIVFVTGVYACARQIYQDRSISWVVCAAAALCTVWNTQGGFNLIIYYMFPWVAFCLLRFYDKGAIEYLWLAGLVILAWVYAGPPYFIAFYLFVTAVMFITLGIVRHKVFMLMRPFSARSIAVFTALVLLAALVGMFVIHMPDNMSIVAPGRQAHTGKVPISQFLTYGGVLDSVKLTQSLVSGNLPGLKFGGYNFNCTVYFGFFPFLLALVSMLWLRRASHLMFLVVMATVVALSAGGLFARTVYFFPLMSYFRLIGVTLGVAKVAAIFCAGFTLDEFLSWPASSLKSRVSLSALTIAGAALASGPELWSMTEGWDRLGAARFAFYLASICLSFAAILYGLSSALKFDGIPVRSKKIIAALLTAAVVLDLASYQEVVYRSFPLYPANSERDLIVMNARALDYAPKRTSGPVTPLQIASHNVIYGPSNDKIVYGMSLEFSDIDQDYTQLRWDVKAKAAADLLAALPPSGSRFESVVGASAPKLRLLKRAIAASTDQSAATLLARIDDPAHSAVIQTTSPLPAQAVRSVASAGTVLVRDFQCNGLTASVDVTQSPGAWLIYDDSYSPGWHASDNGKTIRIDRADTAFKAVWLPTGHHEVRFWYWNGMQSDLADLFAAVGFVIGLIMLGGAVWVCRRSDLFEYMPLDIMIPAGFQRRLELVSVDGARRKAA